MGGDPGKGHCLRKRSLHSPGPGGRNLPPDGQSGWTWRGGEETPGHQRRGKEHRYCPALGLSFSRFFAISFQGDAKIQESAWDKITRKKENSPSLSFERDCLLAARPRIIIGRTPSKGGDLFFKLALQGMSLLHQVTVLVVFSSAREFLLDFLADLENHRPVPI